MAVKDKKARFNPFVLPSDFFKSDGDPVYLLMTKTEVMMVMTMALAFFYRSALTELLELACESQAVICKWNCFP